MREMILAAGFAALTLSAALALALAASPAIAGPLPIGNEVFGAGGDVIATYIGFSAADTDTVELAMPGAMPFFINNKTPMGTTYNIGDVAAGKEIEFQLTDLTFPDTFFTGPGSRNPDGDVHAFVGADPHGIPGFATLPLLSQTFAVSLEAADTVIVGFEDRPAHSVLGPGDFDNNDLVFAVTEDPASTKNTPVSEPESLGLLAFGLLAAWAWVNRGRRGNFVGLGG